MFRDSDLDSCYDVQPNATCTDCGVDFSRGENDPGTLCDPCSDRRDAHTSMLARRLVMAKALHPSAALASAPTLTAAEMSLAVALLGHGWPLQRAIDKIQVQRGRLPFGSEVA